MPVLQVFDPPMCCSSGVCGPAVDPVLPRFASDLEWLKGRGVDVRRFNLARQPEAFGAHPAVREALLARDTKCLPLILVDGVVAHEGGYPSRAALAGFCGLSETPGLEMAPTDCCSSGHCC